MKDLKQLISEKEKELQSLENSLGLGFPIIEQAKSTRICYLQAELENLRTLDEQPQLNDNQKIVLEWLESYADKNSGDRPMQTIFYMWDCIKSNMFGVEELTALRKLTRTEQFEVIAAFAAWGLEQEET